MTASHRDQFCSTVVTNTAICREHYRLTLGLDRFPATDPGQFVQLACRDLADPDEGSTLMEWKPAGAADRNVGSSLRGPVAYLRRPFSLAGRRDASGGVELEIIHRVVGVGTDWLSRLRPGDPVGVLGPLGNRFSLPEGEGVALLAAGGVGIPPMLYLAERLTRRKAIAFCGAVCGDLLPLTIDAGRGVMGDGCVPCLAVEEFARFGVPTVLSTDDGSIGYRGYVTGALQAHLEAAYGSPTGVNATAAAARSSTVIYTCGPEPMMKRVAAMAMEWGVQCQVAVERAMACGMGTCQSCCIRVRKPDPTAPPLPGKDWCWRLACTDGPIFHGADLLW